MERQTKCVYISTIKSIYTSSVTKQIYEFVDDRLTTDLSNAKSFNDAKKEH